MSFTCTAQDSVLFKFKVLIKQRNALSVHGVCVYLGLIAHSVSENFGLIAHSVYEFLGLNAHSVSEYFGLIADKMIK